MGDIKSYVQDWLEDSGNDLGYDMDSLPEMQDIDWIAKDKVEASMYFDMPSYKYKKREFIKLTGGK